MFSIKEYVYDIIRDRTDENGKVRNRLDTVDTYLTNIKGDTKYLLFNKRQSTNIYEREWDVLLLLDCMTTDMVQEVKGEYDFLDNVGTHRTPGTCSGEWMRRTFNSSYSEEMSNTVHVSSNTSTERMLNEDDFRILDEVWIDGWSEEIGTIPAREVTNRAIHYGRKFDQYDRMIIHYMQPHLPFVEKDINSNQVTPVGTKGGGLNLEELKQEGYSDKELWDASVDNLRYVLDDVSLLLHNIDAEKVVISSDHGQAFGDEGIYGHPGNTYIDDLTEVPWVVTSASDERTYETEYEPQSDRSQSESDIEDKLRSLGYL